MTDKSAATDSSRASGDLGLIILLAAVTAIGPFTLHMLSPALPEISATFDVPAAAAQIMLSLSLVAMAISTLIWGPLSDRFGRRPVLLAGLAMAAIGSALAAIAPGLFWAVLGRLLQAAGGAAGMVLARAVAQDVFGASRSAGVIGQITAVMVAAPMVAPTISGLIVEATGWRATFVFSALIATVLVIWSRASMPETSPASGGAMRIGAMLAGFAEIAKRRRFWRHAGYAAASLASFYYFVAITPFVMRDAFGAGPAVYGLYFMILSVTFMATNFIAGRVAEFFGAERTLAFGACLATLGPAIGATLLLYGVEAPWVLFLPNTIQSLGAGLAMPHAMAGAVGAAPERAGAASGLLGFAQFLVASLTTQVAGFLPHDVPLTVPIGMLVIIAPGLLCLFVLRGRSA